MTSLWKYLKWMFVGTTGLLLALVLFLFFWINPNDYRDDITQVVKDNVGLILKIKGDIGWNVYPAIGFSVADVSLATSEGETPLLTVAKAAVSVELIPLLSKQVNVRTLYVDGLVAKLWVNEAGKGNWEALNKPTKTTPTPSEKSAPAPADADSSPLKINVPKVVITHTVIDYDDRKGKSRYIVTVKELSAKNINLATEFPLYLAATIEDGTGVLAQPFYIKGPLAVNLAADTATIGPLQLSTGKLNGTLAIAVKQLTKALSFTGTLEVAPFNAKDLIRDFGRAAPITTEATALTRIGLKTAIEGTSNRALLNPFVITLDDTQIKGNIGITDFATQALVFDLAINAINADHYLPPPPAPVTDTPATPSAAGKPEPLLPMETLRTLNINGKLHADKITFMEWPMTNLAIALRAKNGTIQINPLSASVLEGTVHGDVQIDARGAEPRIVTHLKLHKVEMGGVVKHYAGRDLFAGKASLNLDLNTTGNDTDTLLKQAIGHLDLNFSDALIKDISLNNLLIETLTEQLGAFSMWVPDYSQKLSKEPQKDTALNEFSATATLQNGIAHTPVFKAGVKDGSVKGSGQFNLLTMDFDYHIAMRTDKLKDNKHLANAEFPLRCKGNIAGSAADWCRPDNKAIGNVLKQAAESAAKDKVKGELAKQLGVESTDTKEKAQQKIDEEKKKAEEKAKEKLNKKLDKVLKNLF